MVIIIASIKLFVKKVFIMVIHESGGVFNTLEFHYFSYFYMTYLKTYIFTLATNGLQK